MTTHEIARREQPSSALVTREYLNERRALVRELYADGTSDLEFEHFIEVCATRGLNPLAKQIYCVMRMDRDKGRKVPTIQTSIDGYRLIAQRTGQYRGQVGPEWCGPDGIWREVWLDADPPAAARVGVVREGFTEPLYGVARWASYVQTTSSGSPSKFWKQMPDVMLAKVAESLALRKAFPEELSGLYTSEEMGQADAPQAGAPARKPTTAEIIATRQKGAETRAEKLGLVPVEFFPTVGIAHPRELANEVAWKKVDDELTAREAAKAEADAPLEGEVVNDPPDAPEPTGADATADALWAETAKAAKGEDPQT